MLLFLFKSFLLLLLLSQDMLYSIASTLLPLCFFNSLLACFFLLKLFMLCLLLFFPEEHVFNCLSFLQIRHELSLLLFSFNFLFLQFCRLLVKLVFVLLEFESLGQRHYSLLVLCLNDGFVGVAGHLVANIFKLC